MVNRVSDSRLSSLPAAVLIALLFIIACGNRASPSPKPQAPPSFEFIDTWGNKGEGPGKLDAPVAFAADTLGNVFFADPGDAFVHKFKSNGTPLQSFEDSRVRHAAGITVDSGGAIYVADAQRGTVLIFFPDGTFLRSLRIAPQRKFSGAFGITTDEQGNLYVPDPGKSRILKFDVRGRLLRSWPAPQKAESADERPSSVVAAANASLFVIYFKTGRIEKFSSDGSWMNSWPALDRESGNSDAVTGFTAAGEFVLALAAPSMRIRVWTMDGQKWLDASLEERLGAIAAPQIAVTPRAELLVFDPAAPKVFRFRMHLQNREPK